MKRITVFPPLLGAVINLAQVPDITFSNRLVGDGLAIEPFDNHIYAPFSGTIKMIHSAKHAITITNPDNIDILVHIGLETVALGGKGFKINVTSGDRVTVGEIIGEFDLDFVSQTAKSLASPILVLESNNYQIDYATSNVTCLTKPLLYINLQANINNIAQHSNTLIRSKPVVVSCLHGIHARPAAILSGKAREYDTEVLLELNGKMANVKSIIALLGLAVNNNDTVYIHAANQHIIDNLILLINSFAGGDINANSENITEEAAVLADRIDGDCYYGVVASSGIAVGKLIKQNRFEHDIIEQSTDNFLQKNRFVNAINKVKLEIEGSIKLQHGHLAIQDILSAHLVLLTDPDLLSQVLHLIGQNKTAEYALTTIINKECKTLLDTGNTLMMERRADLRDICNRLLLVMGRLSISSKHVTEPTILLAEDFSPSDVIGLDKNIIGLISVNGGTTSHVAILAKSRGIPLLVGVSSKMLALSVKNVVLLDSVKGGYVNIAPTQAQLKVAEYSMSEKQQQYNIKKAKATDKAVTLDNLEISCLGNIGSVSDAMQLLGNGAEGIGLFRTEFIFLDKDKAPSCEEQEHIYRQIANISGCLPFIIRTLDAGGEKQISYLNMQHELNPVLGIRGIRLCLEHKQLFADQLMAILKLNRPNIKIMLPMISSIEEYRQCRELVKKLKQQLRIDSSIELGIMVEVPSVALLSDIFAKEVDFFSIGTNDLSQYTLAIDREHAKLASQIDHLHPAILRSIKLVVEGAAKHNRPVSVCGLMASERLAIPVLIGLGIRELSMSINAIPENKAFIRELNYIKCVEIAKKCLTLATSSEIRSYLTEQFV